jgi:PHD-finger/Bromodomain
MLPKSRGIVMFPHGIFPSLFRYYISGHMSYLDRHPDNLGSKTGNKRRIPLWIRAAQLQKKSKLGNDESSSLESWWTEEWLHGLTDENLGDYPIICRVEQTHAEFPPDPFCKVVRTDQNNDSTTVYFKKPKAFQGTCKTNVRLAVTLRPLTPLLAPSFQELESLEAAPQKLPPTFTVVTFPCELEPFVVPFAWCYTKSHHLSTNLPVSFQLEEGNEVRISKFSTLWNRDTMQLEERKLFIEHLLSLGRNELEKLLLKERTALPARDIRIVLDRWYEMNTKNEQTSSAPFGKSGDDISIDRTLLFSFLLRSSLPLWKSVTVMKKKNERSKRKISPWLLDAIQVYSGIVSPWALDGSDEHFYLDESLRMKLECAVEDVVAMDEEIKDMFFDPVTEDCAPSYFCAVPIGMCFSTILKRIKVHSGNKTCYYRSADAMIADVRSILACCLLYNSPDSEVVNEADSVVTYAKDVLAKVAQDHNRTGRTTRSYQNDYRPLVLSHCQPRSWFVNHRRKPSKGTMHRDWLESILPNDQAVGLVNGVTASADFMHPPFQAGDNVLYSRDLHRCFLDGHASSLQPDQCILPSLRDMGIENSGQSAGEDWVVGEVYWTRSSFPNVAESEESCTFMSIAVVQAVGVKFPRSHDVCLLFWRPCLFSFDVCKTGNRCPGCGLSSSFIRICDRSDCELESASTQVLVNADQVRSLDQCISLLKRRCLRSVDPASVDPLLTKENVRSGYKTPAPKIGRTSLPAYDSMLCMPVESEENGAASTHHGTRGVKVRHKKEEGVEVKLLVDSGFLPSWRDGLSNPKPKDLPKKFDFILPAPMQCLEFVLVKLQKGFYRHTAAVENDIVEAYVSNIVSLVYDKATRNASPISLKRIAQFVLNEQDNTMISNASKEEMLLIKRVRQIRRLYATALVCVMDSHRSERVFGLSNSVPPKRVSNVNAEHDHSRDLARQQLMYLVTVFGRDLCLNVFGKPENYVFGCLPRIKVTVKYFGEHNSSTSLTATVNSLCVRVNVVCGGFSVISRDPRVVRHTMKPEEMSNFSSSLGFNPDEYEKNDELSRLFFTRPGRANACVRCQAHKRSMLSCRVLRRHSNPDFDWAPFACSGTCFVDDLIMALSPTAARLLDSVPFNSSEIEPIPQLNVPNETHPKTSTDLISFEEDCDLDPRPFAEQAAKAVSLATKIFAASELFGEAPLRLSKNFIDRFFPVDKSDGHYLYCVVCGLSGDLLCCDGCANVVHSSCISLEVLPDGDWFCEECLGERVTALKSTNTRTSISHTETPVSENWSNKFSPEEVIASDWNKPSSICRREAFGRTLFDDSTLDFLMSQIDCLRTARPTQKFKPADLDETAADHDDDVDCIREESENANASAPRKKRGRPRMKSKVTSMPLVTSPVDESNHSKRHKKSLSLPSNPSDKQPDCPDVLSQLKTLQTGARITEVEVNVPRRQRGLAIADTNVPILRSKAKPGKRSFAARVNTLDQDISLPVRQSKRNRLRTARLVDSL